MRNLVLRRIDFPANPSTQTTAYGMELTVLSANDMPTEVFVKKRTATFPSVVDEFVTVASPVQLEDLLVNEPGDNSSYFRVSSVSFVAENPAYFTEIYDEILVELKALIANLNALDEPAAPALTVRVTDTSVETV